MLYSTLLVATSAFASFAAAQNSTSNLPSGFPSCCTPPTAPNSTVKDSWCNANQNTCVEICGDDSEVKAGGNKCDAETLDFTCQCNNGTEPKMSDYQQSVPGLECREWFRQCNIAAGDGFESAEWKRNCESIADSQCGNKTITQDGEDSTASASSSSVASRTSGSPSATNSGSGGAPSETPAAATLNMAREFGLPILAGGLVAVFGIAL